MQILITHGLSIKEVTVTSQMQGPDADLPASRFDFSRKRWQEVAVHISIRKNMVWAQLLSEQAERAELRLRQ